MNLKQLQTELAEACQKFDLIEAAILDDMFDGASAGDITPSLSALEQCERRIAKIEAQIAALKKQSEEAAREAQTKLF